MGNITINTLLRQTQRYIREISDNIKQQRDAAKLRQFTRDLERQQAIEGLLLRITKEEFDEIMKRDLTKKAETPQTLF